MCILLILANIMSYFYNIVIDCKLVLLYHINSLAEMLDLLISKFRKNSPFTQNQEPDYSGSCVFMRRGA